LREGLPGLEERRDKSKEIRAVGLPKLAAARERLAAAESAYRAARQTEQERACETTANERLVQGVRDKVGVDCPRDAEEQIVAFANETLQHVSDGDLALEEDTAPESTKAFDLRVRRVGGEPIGVAFLSGSQRFPRRAAGQDAGARADLPLQDPR
jgi:hypothetical protein